MSTSETAVYVRSGATRMSLAFLKAVERYCGLSHPTELETPAIASSKRIKSIQTFIFAAPALGVAGLRTNIHAQWKKWLE